VEGDDASFPSSATFSTGAGAVSRASSSSSIRSNWITHQGEIFLRSAKAASSILARNDFGSEIVSVV
jgi:hypothetical protein